jgi:modulator of FtsH protease
VFVAVSINIDRILHYRALPERALVTVLLLVLVLLVSLLGLTPGQSRAAFGTELLVVSVVAFVVLTGLIVKANTPRLEEESHLASALGVTTVGTVPFIVGAVGVLTEAGGGLYWTLTGIAAATLGAVINAWVLLVEILR